MHKTITIAKELILTPLGYMISGFLENNLCLLQFLHNTNLSRINICNNNVNTYIPSKLSKTYKIHVQSLENVPIFINLSNQIKEYFDGKRKKFEIKLMLLGTPFQKQVWNTLLNLEYGKTISYLELANILGSTKLCRAVARANANNNIAIIVPCHRVIYSNGKLGGYSACIWRKQKLLELEKQNIITNGEGFPQQSF